MALFILQPWFGAILVPAVLVLMGGVIRWTLAGGVSKRDHFLFGVELTFVGLSLGATKLLDWFRRYAVSSTGSVEEGISAVLLVLFSIICLILVLPIMRNYIDILDRKRRRQPAITWGRWWVVNIVGGSPLGLAVYYFG